MPCTYEYADARVLDHDVFSCLEQATNTRISFFPLLMTLPAHPHDQLARLASAAGLPLASCAFAAHMDAVDATRDLRGEFCIPKVKDVVSRGSGA
jgi:hypothetical protein